MNITRTLVSTAILVALTGCGGGDGGGSSSTGGGTSSGNGDSGSSQPTSEAKIGVFTDSAVANLKYETTKPDGTVSLTGITDSEGEYQFNEGEMVSFYIGDLHLGSTQASEVVTPLELPAPIKVSQILQSFDSDGDPDVAGITIPHEIHELLEDSDNDAVETLVDKLVASVEQVDEDFDTAFNTFFIEFSNEVANVNADLHQKIRVVKAAEAKAHLEKNEHIAQKGGVEKRLIERLEEIADDDRNPRAVLNFLKATELFPAIEGVSHKIDYTAAIQFEDDEDFDKQEINRRIEEINRLLSWKLDADKSAKLGNQAGQQEFSDSLRAFVGNEPINLPALDGLTESQVLEFFVKRNGWLEPADTMTRVNGIAMLQTYAAGQNQSIDMTNTLLQILLPNIELKEDYDYLQWIDIQQNYVDLANTRLQVTKVTNEWDVLDEIWDGEKTSDEVKAFLEDALLFKDNVIVDSVDYAQIIQPTEANNTFDLNMLKTKINAAAVLTEFFGHADFETMLATDDGKGELTALFDALDIRSPDLTQLNVAQILTLLSSGDGSYSVDAARNRLQGYLDLEDYLADPDQHLDRQNSREILEEIFSDLDFKYDADFHSMIVLDGAFIDLEATHQRIARLNAIFGRFQQPNANMNFLWYAFQMAGVTDIVREQDYRFEALFDGGNYDFNTIKMQVATINSLAAFARKSALWPAQERFPDSPVSQDDWNADELQQLILDAGFTIPVKNVGGETVDHNIDLILDHKNNTLDLVQTQRSLNAIGKASGVASMKVNSHPLINNNFYHFALRNDGSIVAWRINMDRNDYEQQTPVVVEMNTAGPKATEMFSIQHYGAALRKDGSVIVWNSLNPDGVITVPEGLDGTIPVVTIVGSERAFAAVRSDGSVVMFGTEDLGDFEQYKQDLDGSKHKVVSLHATNTSFTALMDNGSVVTWGNVSAADQDKLALQVPGHGPGSREQDRHLMIDAIYTTRGAFAAIKGDGSVVTWEMSAQVRTWVKNRCS